MGQILWDWTWIAVMPLLAAAAYITALDPPVRGSGLYGLRTVTAVFLTTSSLTAAVILRAKNRR